MIEETKEERFKREQKLRELLGDSEYERLYKLAAKLLEEQFKSALRISD